MDKWIYLMPIVVNFARYFLIAGFAFLIFYKIFRLAFRTNKIQLKNAGSKDFLREIAFSMQTSLIMGLFALIFLYSPLKEYTLVYQDINLYSIWWIPLSLILAFLIHDTYFYWMHRMVHHPNLFKLVHLTHHKSTNPSPLSSYSFGILEALLEALIAPILMLCIPLHPFTLLLFAFGAFSVNVYGHLGYEIVPKWFRSSFLFQIINTSVHHNLHHEKFNGNYGLYFRVWDRLLKTEQTDYVEQFDKIQKRRFGKRQKTKKTLWFQIPILIGLFACFSFSSEFIESEPDISGFWISEGENGKGLVRIYLTETEKYNGEFIKALDPEKQLDYETNYKSKGNLMPLILEDFEYLGERKWGNGKIFVPSRKITVDGSIELLKNGKLMLKGGLLGFSKCFYWERQKKSKKSFQTKK
tara:strand:- start:32935 stop:34167 length:1233 start_codon:yes stop_codon:yes gene_type:complete